MRNICFPPVPDFDQHSKIEFLKSCLYVSISFSGRCPEGWQDGVDEGLGCIWAEVPVKYPSGYGRPQQSDRPIITVGENQNAAAEFCTSLDENSRLVEVYNEEQQARLEEILRRVVADCEKEEANCDFQDIDVGPGLEGASGNHWWWTGLRKNEEGWRWGSGKPMEFENWMFGDKDGVSMDHALDFAKEQADKDFRWNFQYDYNYDYEWNYVYNDGIWTYGNGDCVLLYGGLRSTPYRGYKWINYSCTLDYSRSYPVCQLPLTYLTTPDS